MKERRQQWEQAYQGRPLEQLGWYQPDPETSITLIGGPEEAQPLIDIGCGGSVLVDRLLELGFDDITLLDLSPSVLAQVHQRLKGQHNKVKLIASDLLTQPLPAGFRCWHDRAVFHFLTEPEEQAIYVKRLKKALLPGGRLVLSGFAPGGPERCNGLRTIHHTVQTLQVILGPDFELRSQLESVHISPSGGEHPYLHTVWRKGG